MAECKVVGTPMEADVKLSTEDSSPLVEEAKYRRPVDSLIYLCNTQPNISFATGILSRFSNHWRAGMQVLKYIKGSLYNDNTYTKGNTLNKFYDSNWVGRHGQQEISKLFFFPLI